MMPVVRVAHGLVGTLCLAMGGQTVFISPTIAIMGVILGAANWWIAIFGGIGFKTPKA